MTFTTLQAQIQGNRLPNYYETLLTHSEVIVREVGLTNKKRVGEALNLNPTQFSLVYPCILAHIAVCSKA